MDKSLYYWAGIVLYSLTVIGIGFYVWLRDKKRGKEQDNVAYWEASRNLSAWSVGLSISASMMSVSWSSVYGVQLFYWYGLGGGWLLIVPWLLTMAGFFVLAPVFRKFHVFSQPQLLEKRFGKRTRQLLAPTLILVFTIWAGAEIYAAGILIAPFLKISVPQTLFLIAFIVAVYSYSGGFEAVVSTDKIQFVLVAVFISAIAFLGVNALPPQASLWHTPPPPKMQQIPVLFSPGWALIIMTFLAYMPGWIVETDVWIRLQAARTDGQARKGILIAGFNSALFVGILPFLIGASALILFPPVNGQAPAEIQDGALIFTVMMQKYAPLWLNLALSIGLIAAAMSTIDTCGNVVALSFSHDLMEPVLAKRWDQARLNRFARFSSVGAIFLAFVYALFTESLWDIFYLSSGLLTTTVFLPVTAVFIKSLRTPEVNRSIVLGFLATVVFYFMEAHGLLHGLEPAFIARTGLGYILWGFIAALAGLLSGPAERFIRRSLSAP